MFRRNFRNFRKFEKFQNSKIQKKGGIWKKILYEFKFWKNSGQKNLKITKPKTETFQTFKNFENLKNGKFEEKISKIQITRKKFKIQEKFYWLCNLILKKFQFQNFEESEKKVKFWKVVSVLKFPFSGRCGYNRSQPQPAVHIFLTQICNLAGICHVDLNSTLSETSTLPTIISEPIDTTRRTTQKLSDKATTDKSADRTTTDKSIDITTDKPTDKPITESIKTTEDQYAEKPQFHRHATMLKGHKRTEKYQLFWIFMIFMIFLWIWINDYFFFEIKLKQLIFLVSKLIWYFFKKKNTDSKFFWN